MYQKYKMFIFTENVDRLITFYTQGLGLEIVGDLKLPRDYGYAVRVADGYDLWIANHSDVSGVSQETFRTMLNLYTDQLLQLFEKVKEYPGVTVIQEPVAMQEFNPKETERWVCTFTDPDGNCIQLMGIPQ
jgi:predicted enzyme related to lactoylglutathione lyase